MNEEEKKAIELLIKYSKRDYPCDSCKYCTERPNVNYSIKTIVNLIEKQSKMIDLMAEQLTSPINGKEWVIKYYEKEVEE